MYVPDDDSSKWEQIFTFPHAPDWRYEVSEFVLNKMRFVLKTMNFSIQNDELFAG